MSRLWQRPRELALNMFLWGQRYRWPLPPALRNAARNMLAGIDQPPGSQSRVDEWPQPLIQRVQGDDPVRLPRDGTTPGNTTSVSSTSYPQWPDTRRRRLRCMVATGTLDLGGLEIVALFLAHGLPSHGLDTVVAHTPLARSGERPADSLRCDGVPVVKLSQHDIRPWLETHRPDVISMHCPPDWLVAAAAEARIPTIETLHGMHSFFDRDTWPSEQLRSRQITGFVAVSELVRRQYLRANPEYLPERIVTIPNGVDSHHIIHRDRSEARAWLGLRNEFLFVSLARYALQKNTFGLVTAFSDVGRMCPEAHLLVAGGIVDPFYFEQVRRLRDGSPCAGQIHLHGPCPDVSTVLAAADAFVLDSFFEGWSLASMEALFAGLPVILSEVGGAREQAGENGRRGFVVGNPLGDPEAVDWPSMGRVRFCSQVNRAALIEAMCAVVAGRDHWREAREELKAESANRFSIDACVQRHADLLTRAAAASGSHVHSLGDDPQFGSLPSPARENRR
jgi:glycosyltransferase involved in cell wall biosynthesis